MRYSESSGVVSRRPPVENGACKQPPRQFAGCSGPGWPEVLTPQVAERLAALELPIGELSGLDLTDFAIVVASSNNAAVENVSLELPLRGKALDSSLWHDDGLAYFAHSADAVLGIPPAAPEGEHAWGLMAARLGKADNFRSFFQRFWWDEDWGLNDWLNQVAWPDAAQNRSKQLSKLAEVDPPPRLPEALAIWLAARDRFRQALAECRAVRDQLTALDDAGARLRELEAQLPAAEERLQVVNRDLASATRAVATAQADQDAHSRHKATELSKLAALSSVAPSAVAKLFRTQAWQAHEASMRGQVGRLDAAQDGVAAAAARLAEAVAEERRRAALQQEALSERDRLCAEANELAQLLEQGPSETDGTLPGPGFWSLPNAEMHRAAPWNVGAFRAARDRLFVAAVQLHRAFIVAAARTIKPSLNTIAKAAQGGPNAPTPTATDWGVFFLLVPVVSTRWPNGWIHRRP